MPLSVLRVKKNLGKYFEKIYSSREDIEISEVKSLAKGWETELFWTSEHLSMNICKGFR